MAPYESEIPRWDLDDEEALREEQRFKVAGIYERKNVSNLQKPEARLYFNLGLRRLFGYHHQEAIKYFDKCQYLAPDCALVPALMALCHGPNYNFTGDAYYSTTSSGSDGPGPIEMFPCQESAYFYAKKASEVISRLNSTAGNASVGRNGKKKRKNAQKKRSSTQSTRISEIECLFISAVQKLTKEPGVCPEKSEEVAGRPYADALRNVHRRFKHDPDIAYFFAESLLNLNAWELYEFFSSKTLSEDVDEARVILEQALKGCPHHPGLCHMYIHLCEMSPDPSTALEACEPLRTKFPNLGHLIHMPTHIDVLVGDYEACVRYNRDAINSDMDQYRRNPDSAGVTSYYFGYIVHNFHMLVYGAILGGMEKVGMDAAAQLNEILTEELFENNNDLTPYIEAYAALDVHVMVRFGRWKELLDVSLPKDEKLMLYRAGSIHYAKALAHAALGDIKNAKKEADLFDGLATLPSAGERLLHNNLVSRIFEVDVPMIRGEIAYREGNYDEAFNLLRKAVTLQDALKYDEPWGKMQPIRHALGGLLLEQNHFVESESVFRNDLKRHPKNPWALTGLINCLKKRIKVSNEAQPSCCEVSNPSFSHKYLKQENVEIAENEIQLLEAQLRKQRQDEWTDFEISVSCECCDAM